jgi:uncharacterized protein (TIGR00730 family)
MGNEELYAEEAFTLGKTLAIENITLVYGGAKIGLMGKVADGALSKNGKVIGVLPKFLSGKEIMHEGLSELILCKTMHERKTKMNELCEGVIALPGGFGTLEELFEMLTWAQLGLHKKPIGLLNINEFYSPLISMIQTMVNAQLLKESNKQLLLIDTQIDSLLNKMKNYQSPQLEQWIHEEEL